MAREVVFEEQTITGFTTQGSLYSADWEATFTPVGGEKYTVLWDGEEYTYTAVDGGDGLIGIGEMEIPNPFGIVFVPGSYSNLSIDLFTFVTVSTDESHTVAIYHVVEEKKLIIKDPHGDDVEYPQRGMLRLNTSDGTVLYSKGQALENVAVELDFSDGDQNVKAPDGYLVKSAIIAKPADCVPENILKDKNIGNIVGTLELPEQVETTIDPDFSAGDMVVTPESGQAFNSVTVTKPANLLPENIKKDEVVAGIVGTLEAGGGGGDDKCVFMCFNVNNYYYKTPTSSYTVKATCTLPLTANVLSTFAYLNRLNGAGTSLPSGFTFNTAYVKEPEISTTASNILVAYSGTFSASLNIDRLSVGVIVSFEMMGISVKEINGEHTLLASEDADISWLTGVYKSYKDFTVCDLSAIAQSDIPKNMLDNSMVERVIYPKKVGVVNQYAGNYRTPNLRNVIFSGDVDEISNYAFYANSAHDLTVDFSNATFVPVLGGTLAFNARDGLQILVPAALYDEWIAATNWTAYADYIVAV